MPDKYIWAGFHWMPGQSPKLRSWLIRGLALLFFFMLFVSFGGNSAHGEGQATYPKWSKVELQFSGPNSSGMGDPNPFQVQVDVTFSGPGSQVFVVPAFYDGDGGGGLDGNVWKVRFSPNAAGTWDYVTNSPESSLDGHSGSFEVSDTAGCQTNLGNGLPNFACVGRLEHVDAHYLKFADGPFWLKGGVDEPEDFLVPTVNAGFSSKSEAIDYLADLGLNSIYLMLNNVDGDRRNIWPWVGSDQEEAKINHERFDVARLAEWEDIFNYMEGKGLVTHIVFEDDQAWTGFNRAMYYREVVARFGHHNGLYWNLAEEYNEVYSSSEIKDFAQLLRDLDPYDHPLTVHQEGPLSNWDPFVGDARFDLTSLQTTEGAQNSAAVQWYNKVEAASKTIPVAFDESTRLLTADERDEFRHVNWSIYTGGGITEVFTRFSSPGSGYQEYDLILKDLARARKYINDLPFWEMSPKNNLLDSGTGYVFAKPGETYLVYLPEGGSLSLDLSGSNNTFQAEWFDPRNGSIQAIGSVFGGAPYSFDAPDTLDWVLLLQNADPSPPQISSSPPQQGIVGELYWYDVEASGSPSPTFSLVSAPTGMVIDSISGLVEWTPQNEGEFGIEIQAENAAGSDTQVYTLIVEKQPSSTPIPSGTPTDAPPEVTTTPEPPDFTIFIPFVRME